MWVLVMLPTNMAAMTAMTSNENTPYTVNSIHSELSSELTDLIVHWI